MSSITSEISISAPIEKIWSSWTNSKRITKWWVPAEAKINAEVNGSFELYFDAKNHNHQNNQKW